MSFQSEDMRIQPDTVVHELDKSGHSFVAENEERPWFRDYAFAAGEDFAEDIEQYLNSDDPAEFDPELGPALLEEVLADDYHTDEVTEYHVKGFGAADSALIVGVRYRIGVNMEPEAKTTSDTY